MENLNYLDIVATLKIGNNAENKYRSVATAQNGLLDSKWIRKPAQSKRKRNPTGKRKLVKSRIQE
ncbi:MAG: hypothetical protein ACYDGO_03345 [Smithellaceae bacterium]